MLAHPPASLCWTVLGAGTASPHPTRSPSGHLLTYNNTRILLDMGAGTLWRLARCGVSWEDLDAIVITHAHLDHTLDLQALMFASRIPGHTRKRDLNIHVGPGMPEFLDRFHQALGKWFEPGGFKVHLHVHDGSGPPASVGPVALHFAPVKHHATSIGVRLEVGDRSIAYSGDSAPCASLSELCQNVDLAVVECSTLPENPLPSHMTPLQVGGLALQAGAAQIAAVHRYPELDGFDVAASIKTTGFEGTIIVPDDLHRIALL